MKLDILAFAAHPDDVELSCSGTLLKSIAFEKKCGIVDLTLGELGTRGTAEIRKSESEASTKILGIHSRENLEFPDGFFENNKENQLDVIRMIRKYQPEIIIANAIEDRHPDHGKAAKLISDACFLSGLIKVETSFNSENQMPWRPKAVYHYIQDRYIKPDFVVDITDQMDKKMESIKAFTSQFYDPKSKEPSTYISSADFLDSIIARAKEFGRIINVKYAEGFTTERIPGIENILDLK